MMKQIDIEIKTIGESVDQINWTEKLLSATVTSCPTEDNLDGEVVIVIGDDKITLGEMEKIVDVMKFYTKMKEV